MEEHTLVNIGETLKLNETNVRATRSSATSVLYGHQADEELVEALKDPDSAENQLLARHRRVHNVAKDHARAIVRAQVESLLMNSDAKKCCKT